MSLNLISTPGPRAAAGFMQMAGAPALVLYLDPGDFAIQVPPFPGGARFLATFCRQLSREAGKLADALERPDASTPTGRHALIADAPDGGDRREHR